MTMPFLCQHNECLQVNTTEFDLLVENQFINCIFYLMGHKLRLANIYRFKIFNLTKFDPLLKKLHNQTNPNSLDIDLGTVML
jgi:hypothetical protein